VAARRPGDGSPGYKEIADALREQITSGELPDGAVIPGEDALMERYGVARATARSALAVLRNEGIAVTRRGSRTRVRLFRPLRRHGSKRLAREHWGSGRAIWDVDTAERGYTPNTQVSEDSASPDIADALGIEPGAPVVVRSRKFLVGSRPVQIATSYLPASIAAGTRIAEVDTGPGGMYARLRELGYSPATFSEEIRARMPSPDEIEALDLPQGTPVIEIIRRAATKDGTVVEVNKMVLDSYAYVLEYSIEA
jgi:GntR family transcriptional regulator